MMGKLPFRISIAENKEALKKEASKVNEKVKVYSDRSAINGQVGAAAILIRTGHPPSTLHFHLGPVTKHTVHEVELIGILLALHLIKKEKTGSTTHAIRTDNQAAIKAFRSAHRGLGTHLAKEILCTTNQLQK